MFLFLLPQFKSSMLQTFPSGGAFAVLTLSNWDKIGTVIKAYIAKFTKESCSKNSFTISKWANLTIHKWTSAYIHTMTICSRMQIANQSYKYIIQDIYIHLNNVREICVSVNQYCTQLSLHRIKELYITYACRTIKMKQNKNNKNRLSRYGNQESVATPGRLCTFTTKQRYLDTWCGPIFSLFSTHLSPIPFSNTS